MKNSVSLEFKVIHSGIICRLLWGTYLNFRPHHDPGVDSAPSENEYQVHFLGVKAACAWGWQPHHLHMPNVMEIWEPKPPWTLWATPGLLQDCFTFTFTFLYLNFYRTARHLIVVFVYVNFLRTTEPTEPISHAAKRLLSYKPGWSMLAGQTLQLNKEHDHLKRIIFNNVWFLLWA